MTTGVSKDPNLDIDLTEPLKDEEKLPTMSRYRDTSAKTVPVPVPAVVEKKHHHHHRDKAKPKPEAPKAPATEGTLIDFEGEVSPTRTTPKEQYDVLVSPEPEKPKEKKHKHGEHKHRHHSSHAKETE